MSVRYSMAGVIALLLLTSPLFAAEADLFRSRLAPEAVEVVEYRNAWSRHYRLPDGTSRAFISTQRINALDPAGNWEILTPVEQANLTADPDSPAIIYPVDEKWHTGTIQGANPPVWPMFLFWSFMNIVGGEEEIDERRAWARFDITTIPQGSRILGIKYNFYSAQRELNPSWQMWNMVNDLVELANDQTNENKALAWLDCGGGQMYLDNLTWPAAESWGQIELPTVARNDFAFRLANDGWFGFGKRESSGDPENMGNALGMDFFAVELAPYLEVTYQDPAGTAEPAPTVRLPEFTVGPNPLTGGIATLRYNLPHNGPAMVRVYDATGRNILSRALATGDRSSSITLDLRDQSAGLYIVRLETADSAVSRKLLKTDN